MFTVYLIKVFGVETLSLIKCCGVAKCLEKLFYKKCSKPNQACDFEHIGKWDKIPAADQMKILEHCHATQGKKVWLDAETFAKHKITVPEKFTYLLGDSNGPMSA